MADGTANRIRYFCSLYQESFPPDENVSPGLGILSVFSFSFLEALGF
jgi:hypothetical protein